MKISRLQKFRSNWLPPLVTFAILVFVLEFVLGWLHVSERVVPRLSSIVRETVAFLKMSNGDYWATLSNMFLGYIIAVPIGIFFAMLLAQSKFSVKAISPLIIVLATTPLMVLVPMLMIWIGWGNYVRFIAVAIQATPIVLLNTLAGFVNVSPEKNEMARLYGAGRMKRFFKIVVPQAWPRIFTGLRLGVINATLGIVSAEFVCKSSGLGNRILISCSFLNIPLVYGCILLVAITSRALMSIVSLIERRVVLWKNT